MFEVRIILLCLPSILLATTLEPETKSILTDGDWKKLWMEAGNANANLKNTVDSSDSPAFDDSEMMAHNTTVQLGGNAFLMCKVAGIDRNQISWIRRRDWHILSSGAQMYTNDERFAILHTPGSNTWTLQIKFVQRRDHGMYECQVSTSTGVISHFVNLQVVVPEAFILGSGELHVDMGSTINLVCIIEKSPTPPQYVYWQKNDRMINYDDTRRDITIDTIPGLRTQSRLIIREPQISDSGNYTCSASNTEPASIYVFVSKGLYNHNNNNNNLHRKIKICHFLYNSQTQSRVHSTFSHQQTLFGPINSQKNIHIQCNYIQRFVWMRAHKMCTQYLQCVQFVCTMCTQLLLSYIRKFVHSTRANRKLKFEFQQQPIFFPLRIWKRGNWKAICRK